MIDWVHQLCREWGDSRYYIENGKSAPSSIWGRINEGWTIASADPTQRPDPPEVMLGGALCISLAIRKAIKCGQMTERQYHVLHVHYAERAHNKQKRAALKMSKQRYYDMLHRAHRVLRRFLPDRDHSQLDHSQLDQTAA